jgi:hypothetical protein
MRVDKASNASSLRGRNTTGAQATNFRVQDAKEARTLTYRERSKHLLQPLAIRAHVASELDSLEEPLESWRQSVESGAEGFPGRSARRSRGGLDGIACRVAQIVC